MDGKEIECTAEDKRPGREQKETNKEVRTLTELERLKLEKKQLEKKIKELTGSSSGVYVKSGQIRFGVPFRKMLKNDDVQFDLDIQTLTREGDIRYKTFARYCGLINTRSGIERLINDLKGILGKINANIDEFTS